MSIASRLAEITCKIEKSSKNSLLSGFTPRIMGVTKGQDEAAIREAIHLGLACFGENRVQEAYEKWPDIKKTHKNLTLHLIGPLQTNKVKQALELFDVIETLDRPKLADEIAKHFIRPHDEASRPSEPSAREAAHHASDSMSHSRCKQFYIQVNTGEEPQKAGILPKEADDFIRYCRDDLKLPVKGLMCIPPAEDVPAPHFALLREIAKRNGLAELSMGMSSDFETAIRMGSTQIRLGTALFGERN